jgi:branched-chain amino acid transport system substrate-binding protein
MKQPMKQRRVKQTRIGMLFIAAALVGSSLIASQTASGQSKGTIKFVSQTPLSGGQSVLGEAIKNGVTLALEDFGKTVTSYGFKFVYEPYDDQAKPDIGAANANKIINDADVLGVVGHLNSGVAIPSSEVYAKVGLTMVTPANTNPTVTDRKSTALVTNRVCGRDDVQGPAAAEFALKTLKAKTFYVLNDKTAYGSGLAKFFGDVIKAGGGTIMFDTGIDAAERDFSSVLNRAVVDKPDVIFYGGIYDQAGAMIKQIRQKSITSIFLGGDGLDGSDLQKLAGAENMKDVYFTTTSAPVSALPAAKKFAQKYKAKFNKDPEGYSAYGYDAARVVIQAISSAIKAGNGAKPTREAVAKAVRTVKFNGVTGPIAFNDRGDPPVSKYVVIAAQSVYTENKVAKLISVAAPTPEMK